jgi:hypothetical protein
MLLKTKDGHGKLGFSRHFELGEGSYFAHGRISDKNDQSKIPRSARDDGSARNLRLLRANG